MPIYQPKTNLDVKILFDNGCGHTRRFIPFFSFRNNGLITLLYVTALPVHIQRCYKVSFLEQGSLKNYSVQNIQNKQGPDLNYSVV